MQLRKSFVITAVLVAAGLVGVTSAAASAGTTTVNGNSSAGTSAINGVFTSGTATLSALGPATYGCSGGSVAGTVQRGSGPAGFSFPTLSLTCNTPVPGYAATIVLQPGCAVTTGFTSGVTSGATDVVSGSATFPTSPTPACVRMFIAGTACTAYAYGTVSASFAETVVTMGGVNYQELTLNGTGGFLTGQSAGCAFLFSGGFALNNIVFSLQVTGGTTTGITFGP
jgi:hypothetical protein